MKIGFKESIWSYPLVDMANLTATTMMPNNTSTVALPSTEIYDTVGSNTTNTTQPVNETMQGRPCIILSCYFINFELVSCELIFHSVSHIVSHMANMTWCAWQRYWLDQMIYLLLWKSWIHLLAFNAILHNQNMTLVQQKLYINVSYMAGFLL